MRRLELQQLEVYVVAAGHNNGCVVLKVGGEGLVEDSRLNLIGDKDEKDWHAGQYHISLGRTLLTIGYLGSLSEVMLDLEALRLRIFRVGVWSVGDEDLVVGNAGVTQVLGLCRALVAEPIEIE